MRLKAELIPVLTFFFLFKLLAEVTYRNEHPKLLC